MRVSRDAVRAIGNAGCKTKYRYGPSSVIICKSNDSKNGSYPIDSFAAGSVRKTFDLILTGTLSFMV